MQLTTGEPGRPDEARSARRPRWCIASARRRTGGPAGLPPLQCCRCRCRQILGPRAVGSRVTKPAALPGAAGAPQRILRRVASPRRVARGGCGGRRAPRRGDPADRHAWRRRRKRRRKRQHRGALRPGPRGRGGGGGDPGRRPLPCGHAPRPSLGCLPAKAARGGARAVPGLPGEEPVSPVALLELDLPLLDHVGLSFAYLPIIDRKRVQDEVSSFLSILFEGSGTRSLHPGPPTPHSQHSHTPSIGNAVCTRVQL